MPHTTKWNQEPKTKYPSSLLTPRLRQVIYGEVITCDAVTAPAPSAVQSLREPCSALDVVIKTGLLVVPALPPLASEP